jgi:hypothetical protein
VAIGSKEGEELPTWRYLKLLEALSLKSLNPRNLINLPGSNVIDIKELPSPRSVDRGPVLGEVGGVDGHAIKVNSLNLFICVTINLEETHCLIITSCHQNTTVFVK